jgi:hypothetical protein
MNEKALARVLYEAKTPEEEQAANARLEAHVKEKEKEGMNPIQVRAAIKAWLTRLKKWQEENDPRYKA